MPTSKTQGYRYYDTLEIPHAHFFNGVALMGGSTVVGVLDKPLAWWASGCAVGRMGWIYAKKKVNGKLDFHSQSTREEAAKIVLDRLQGMTPKAYVSLLDDAYRAHSEVKDKAAEKGTVRHRLLEEYIKPCLELHEGKPTVYTGEDEKVREFVEWARIHVNRFLWSEIHCYSTALWTGGIADVGWEDREGRIIAGDFKSSKEAYYSGFVQIGGYDTMLWENGGFTPKGERIFLMPGKVTGYCIVPFGQAKLDPVLKYNVDEYRTAFRHVVPLYKLKQKFDAD